MAQGIENRQEKAKEKKQAKETAQTAEAMKVEKGKQPTAKVAPAQQAAPVAPQPQVNMGAVNPQANAAMKNVINQGQVTKGTLVPHNPNVTQAAPTAPVLAPNKNPVQQQAAVPQQQNLQLTQAPLQPPAVLNKAQPPAKKGLSGIIQRRKNRKALILK
jgi:hypothetical protein